MSQQLQRLEIDCTQGGSVWACDNEVCLSYAGACIVTIAICTSCSSTADTGPTASNPTSRPYSSTAHRLAANGISAVKAHHLITNHASACSQPLSEASSQQ